MRATKLKTNHMTEPMGIDSGKVILSWIPNGCIKQTAFQIVLSCKDGVLFDSGKVISDKTEFVPPVDMPTKSVIRWSIRLWDESDREGASSETFFETGIGKSEWNAVWICPELTEIPRFLTAADPLNRASYLRKSFNIKKPSHARLYITAHGIYDAWINGKHVDGYLLAPGTTQYPKRLQVQTYDVADLLVDGENEIIVSIGDGWWRGCISWYMKRNTFGRKLALLCQLEADGEVAAATDETWQASQNGPLGLNDMMQLEQYDATVEINDWHEVLLPGYDLNNLVGTYLPITAHEHFKAKKIITPKGELILDFGQNIAGYAEFDVMAKGGEKLLLSFVEVLDKDGNFPYWHNQNPDVPYCRQQVEYTCKPGRNVYHQTKCYYGFRYVKVETDLDITGEEFTAVAIHSDMEQTSFFRCGNSDVNKLFENCVWSMKNNFVDVPTDCPHREKSGASGDLQVFSGTALYLMDSYPVLHRWLLEQAATQDENGCVKMVAPDWGYDRRDGAAGWCDSFEIIPFRMMKLLNSTELIKKLYPQIREWMYFCIMRAKNHRECNADMPRIYRDYFVDCTIMWGEWHEPDRTPYDYDMENIENGLAEVGTAYLAYGCRLTAEMAERLGEAEDAAYFLDIAEKAKNTYRYAFMKDGRINSTRQCHFVRPLALGLLNGEEETKQAAKDLVSLIRQRGALGTGFLTTWALCDVLTDNGYSEVAYDLLLKTDQPSWLYEVQHGATTVWESWFGIQEDGSSYGSHNHYAYGTIAGWLMSRSAGIIVADGVIHIRPYPDKRLGYVCAEYQSPFGNIVSEWKYDGDRIIFNVEIPANATAEIILPDGQRYEVGAGAYTYSTEIGK